MGMTLCEKLLSHKLGRTVSPGELVDIPLDFVFSNDVSAPIAIEVFYKTGRSKVFDKDKVGLIPDHFVPNKDVQAATQAQVLREFAKEQELSCYWDAGVCGIEHALLPEQGIILPGDIVIGGDSHTCTYGAMGAFATGVGSTDVGVAMATGRTWFRVPSTIRLNFTGKRKEWVGGKDIALFLTGQIGVAGAQYKAIEYGGEAITDLSMDDRFTLSNLAIEAGAKVGLIAADNVTEEYVKGRVRRDYFSCSADADAVYEKTFSWDISEMEPQVACPHSPGNVKPVSQVQGLPIQQAVIGSCTNGRIGDLRNAAKILKGRKVDKNVRCFIIPATPTIYKQALKEGLIEIFLEADAIVSPPTCGPCVGGFMGILAKNERAVSTTNRNFVGRMGHITSEIYLGSPAVAAASAVAGVIMDPNKI